MRVTTVVPKFSISLETVLDAARAKGDCALDCGKAKYRPVRLRGAIADRAVCAFVGNEQRDESKAPR